MLSFTIIYQFDFRRVKLITINSEKLQKSKPRLKRRKNKFVKISKKKKKK